MSMVQDVSCLQTTVRNSSGGTKHYAFLGRHGVTLDANEEYTVLGSMENAIAANADDGGAKSRRLAAYLTALQEDALEVVKTPLPHMIDETTGETVTITSDNAVLSAVASCLTDSVSL